jgi:hypothetical protein
MKSLHFWQLLVVSGWQLHVAALTNFSCPPTDKVLYTNDELNSVPDVFDYKLRRINRIAKFDELKTGLDANFNREQPLRVSVIL